MRFIDQVRIDNQRKLYRFGQALKLLRKYNGLTQKDLAKRIGCCEQSIAAYEKGKTFPSTQILHKLAIFFDMPENDLFYENAICPCCGRRLE